MIVIDALRPTDREDWQSLAEGYKLFYNTPTTVAEYDAAWSRLFAGDGVYCLVARQQGRLVGIAHYLFHGAVWSEAPSCYLQDLFVDETLRGQGIARKLIERVADVARDRGAVRYYWQTMQDNTQARLLYDKVARFKGFIRYDYPME